MPDRPTIVAGAAINERIIEERHGTQAATRAAEIMANVRVAHEALRDADTPAEIGKRAKHFAIVMQNAARAALHAPDADRMAIEQLAEMQDFPAIARMIRNPDLLDQE